jgi:hypothetical protein
MFQDSVFMMPHLGVLSTVYRDAAWNIFDKDCLVRLGTNIAAAGTGKMGQHVMNVELQLPGGKVYEEKLNYGDIKLIKLSEYDEAKATITPERDFDVGAGPGKPLETTITGGVAGVILDARGRPIYLPEAEEERKDLLLKWFRELELYPEDQLGELV